MSVKRLCFAPLPCAQRYKPRMAEEATGFEASGYFRCGECCRNFWITGCRADYPDRDGKIIPSVYAMPVNIPVIADCDTGSGNAIYVRRTVQFVQHRQELPGFSQGN